MIKCFWNYFKKPRPGEIYNIGGGRKSNCSVIEALNYVESLANIRVKRNYYKANRVGDHIWYITDTKKFRKHYPHWKQKYDTKKIIDNSSKIYNSMVILDNKLNLISEYNKINLVPFGEFLPFEKFFKKLGLKKISYGYESFSAGNDRQLISLNDKNFNFIPLICYEIIYSGKVNLKSDKTNFIINISEDGWFGDSIGLHQHFSHTIFRAIEEGKNIIRSANNGISAYIDSDGIVISKLESTKKGVIEINKYKKINEALFSKFGNKIFFYILLFYISLIFFIKKWEIK